MISRLQAQIDRQIEDYNKRPRRLTYGVNAVGVNYARYVDAWADTIEQIGTDRFPIEARGKMYDSLIITVEIDRFGNVVDVLINKKSRYESLNRVIKQIVYAGAPVQPVHRGNAQGRGHPADRAHLDLHQQFAEDQVGEQVSRRALRGGRGRRGRRAARTVTWWSATRSRTAARRRSMRPSPARPARPISYERLLVPVEPAGEFARCRRRLLRRRRARPQRHPAVQGTGLRATRSGTASARCSRGAVNTLALDGDGVVGDNTDGPGLVTDLREPPRLRSRRASTVLLLGAGGAARGVVMSLLQAGVASLTVANRTPARAAGAGRAVQRVGGVARRRAAAGARGWHWLRRGLPT